jgi:hypothetical protein
MACTVFFGASAQSTLLLFFSVTLFAKGKKDVCTPIATTVLHLRQKKPNSIYYIQFCPAPLLEELLYPLTT